MTPLKGIRVLDLTNVLAGPFCCQQLAMLGAEVIKIEVPGKGDLARQLGAEPELNQRAMGVSFLAQNAGKKSVTVNLKQPQGKALLKQLVREADVLVENFRPGVMSRLEVGYEVLKAENPQLIYCAISGFGADGPLSGRPAYDQIIQGMSGVMSITGSQQSGPTRVGYPIADTVGGLTAAFAISAALTGRLSGQGGCFIDVAMLDATLSTMGWAISNFLVAGKPPQAMGNDNATASPSGTFRTADGLLNLAANKQEQFEALCRLLQLETLLNDTRFAERQARLAHRTELSALLEERLGRQTAAQWAEQLNALGVPAGEVLDVPQALELPQVTGRKLLQRFDRVPKVTQPVSVVRPGFLFNGQRPAVETPPPLLGQHTDSVLGSLGFSAADLAQLKAEGIV